MQGGAAKVFAMATAGDGLHNGSIEQWTANVIKELYLDEIPAHVSLLMLNPCKLGSLHFGYALPARDSPL